MLPLFRLVLLYLVLPVVLLAAASLVWLSRDAGRPLSSYFDERHGRLVGVTEADRSMQDGQESSYLTLSSDSGLQVSLRVIRRTDADRPLPVLIVLGGHRTGSDAVDLFGRVGERAVVALDYPYAGPQKIRGFGKIVKTIPLARKAIIDTPPAAILAVDWILEQPWADPDRLVIIGASLGVPFATLVAARDERISAAILVHGAADNEAWLEKQVAIRNDIEMLHRPLAKLISWLSYGPTFDTAANVARISPRLVIVIGAREDERMPRGQTEALFAAAGEPKILRWTEGRHVQPGRTEIIADLLKIADELLPAHTAD